MPNDNQTDAFLALADPSVREHFEVLLRRGSGSWAGMQQAFLDMIDEYVDAERAKPIEDHIETHEAGGQWRIAFPHHAARGDDRIAERLRETMAARKGYQDGRLHHGFSDCAEVHHEIETFLYFQIPLFYSGLPGSEVALESIVDVAHHLGNWVDGIPSWYDWETHGFRSTWLGTREVRDFPPHDYQEANHFRFVNLAIAAHVGTEDRRYLDLATDYADRWCGHIEDLAGRGEPIRCSILPEEAAAGEMGFGGKRRDDDKDYKVFYSTVSANTAYDVATALMDLWRVTGTERYLDAARAMIDQFFDHGADGRPAVRYKDGEWQTESPTDDEVRRFMGNMQSSCMIARPALRHDMITGTDRYRQHILDWARVIDEESNRPDQMMADVLVAAHYHDGDEAWLERAYAMAVRVAAVLETDDGFHQCSASSRQGSKFLMPLLYQPLLGGMDWGTRGNLPLLRLKHESGKGVGLPPSVAFRTWRTDGSALSFTARNAGDQAAAWQVHSAKRNGRAIHVEMPGETGRPDADITLDPGAETTGRITFS